MYYCCCLVLLIELQFVDLATVLRGDRIALGLGEVSVPSLVERCGDVRVTRRAAVHFDVHQVRPINFNLHAYSLHPRSAVVNIFRSVFFTFFSMVRSRFAAEVKKNRAKKCDFFLRKRLTRGRLSC